MDRAAVSTTKAESKITTFNQGLQAGISIYNLAAAALSRIDAVFQRADTFGDAAEQFDKLTKSAGQLSDEFINKLSKAADDTITNLDLMQAANKALIAGLDPETFDEVVKAAKNYADANGIDAKSAIDKFTLAISKGNVNLLQSLDLYKDGKIVLNEFTDQQAAAAGKASTLSGVYEILKKKTIDAFDAFLQFSDKKLFDIFQSIGNFITETVTASVEFLSKRIDELTLGFKVLGEVAGALSSGELT